jgi:8-oxo-dGTP pyrophosphatase MutT (NUDIX family)
MTHAQHGEPAFQLLTVGPWRREQVVCQLTDEIMARNAETERLIAEAWGERARRAAERGQLFFAGPMCGLRGWSASGERLELRFGRTDYREFVGTNVCHPEIATRFGEEYLANGAGVCSTIESSDGKLLLHRRSERVFEHPGMLHFCGGSLEPAETPAGPIADPFAVMTREIDEEMGIPAAAIANMSCLGLARDGLTLKPDVLLRTPLSIAAAEVPAHSGEEHAELVIVPADGAALSAWLAEYWDEIAPAGQALFAAYMACNFAAGVDAAWRH